MIGRWTPLKEIDERPALKVGKIITSVGTKAFKHLGKTCKFLREQIYRSLRYQRIYLLDPKKSSSRQLSRKRTLLMENGLFSHIPVFRGSKIRVCRQFSHLTRCRGLRHVSALN